MMTTVYCVPAAKGVHAFYLKDGEKSFFLFSQNYRKGVQRYFSRGVSVDAATDFSRAHGDSALMRTMSKLPAHIRYVEKEYGIAVLRQTVKRNGEKGGKGAARRRKAA